MRAALWAFPRAMSRHKVRSRPCSNGRRPAARQRTASGASGHGRRRCGADLCVFRCRRRRAQAGECCGLLTADMAEFGHADDERERGALADAGNAQYEIKATGEVVMGAQRCNDPQQFARRRAFSRAMSVRTMRRSRGSPICSSRTLMARDVLLDLFDEGQMVCQLRQALIRRDPRPVDRRRTGGDQNRIELIVLGAAQMHAGIALTWIGCSTRTVKPRSRKCSTTPRSYPPVASMPTRVTPALANSRPARRQPTSVLTTCQCSEPT